MCSETQTLPGSGRAEPVPPDSGLACVSPEFTASSLHTRCAQTTVTLSMGAVCDSHGMPTASPEARPRDADLSA